MRCLQPDGNSKFALCFLPSNQRMGIVNAAKIILCASVLARDSAVRMFFVSLPRCFRARRKYSILRHFSSFLYPAAHQLYSCSIILRGWWLSYFLNSTKNRQLFYSSCSIKFIFIWKKIEICTLFFTFDFLFFIFRHFHVTCISLNQYNNKYK